MEVKISLVTSACLALLMTSPSIGQKTSREFGIDLLDCSKQFPFDQCLRNTMESLRGFMSEGFPEFNLGPTEPLHIRNLKFESKPTFANAVKVNAEFSNVIVDGLSGFVTEDLHADLFTRTLKIKLRVPSIRIRGFYRAEGKVVLVTLKGDGPFRAILTNATGEGFGQIVTKRLPNGNQSLSIENTNIDFHIPGIFIEMENLFGGEYPALAKTTNDFLNANSERIIEEVKPQIKFEVTRLFQSVMAKAFSELPIEEFLAEAVKQQPRNNRSLRGFRPVAVRRPQLTQRRIQRPSRQLGALPAFFQG